MEWLSWPTTVAAIVLALGVIWTKVVRPTVRFGQRWLDVMSRVESEFSPNGGTSMKDGLNRVEARQMTVIERLDGQDETLAIVHTKLEDHDSRFDAIEELVTSPPKKQKAAS